MRGIAKLKSRWYLEPMGKSIFDAVGKEEASTSIGKLVAEQLRERILATRGNQNKQLGFFLLAFLDRATSDEVVQGIRNSWRGREDKIKQAIPNEFDYQGLRFPTATKRTHR